MVLQSSKEVTDEIGSDEVIWLLEELVQLDGEDLVAGATAAREAVSVIRGKKRALEASTKTNIRVKRRSFTDIHEHPARMGAARFLGVSNLTGGSIDEDDEDDNKKGNATHKRTSIEELRKRLLKEDETIHDETDEDIMSTETQGDINLSVTPSLILNKAQLETIMNQDTKVFEEEMQTAETATASRALNLLWADIDGPESPYERGALVKTIRNDFWVTFASVVRKTTKKGAKPYYTPTSLTPKGCIGMRLFGRVWAQSAGIVMDRAALQLPQDVWCWRSGFFARTEFGVSSKTTQEKKLRPDLEQALSSLKELEEMAAKGEYEHFGVRKKADDVVPYNEVFAAITPGSILAVFARSWQLGHLLLAMMARDCLERSFFTTDIDDDEPLQKNRIAILVIDASGASPPQAVPFSAQICLLKLVAARAQATSFRQGLDIGDLSLDARPFLLSVPDALRIHACIGLSDAALRNTLAMAAGKSLIELNRRAEATLRRAVAAGNAHAAEAIVRVYATLHTEENKRTDELLDKPLSLPEAGINDDCLRALGAYAVLYALFSGRLAACASQAVDLLDDWLRRADSFAFRVSSWRDAANHPATAAAGPSFAAFAGKKAITNRTRFRDNLLPLALDRHNTPLATATTFDEANPDGPPVRGLIAHASNEEPVAEEVLPEKSLLYHQDFALALDHLADLVASCHSPTLRLELLQFITGLDTRWFRDLLLSSVELARDAVHLSAPTASIRAALSITANNQQM